LSRERNEQIMRTYLEEVLANERLELIPEIANEDMVDEVTAGAGGPPGRDGLVAHVNSFFNAFSDRKITIRRIVANDDEVMAWWIGDGINSGDLGTMAATGQPLTGHAFSFFDIRDGKISRYRLFAYFGYDPPVAVDTTPQAAPAT
jgi:predicted ester cyclase